MGDRKDSGPVIAPRQEARGIGEESSADVAVFCVASPLHYLAACAVVERFESCSAILVAYKPGVLRIVDRGRWQAVVDAPWPRMWPLPGPFGRHRRLLRNVRAVVDACGPGLRGGIVHLHAPVFDAEPVNYLLHALSWSGGARIVRGRILPDGLLNIARYPLSRTKRFAQQLRRLRSLASPQLRYTPFSGDRIGSDAPFVDRVYTLKVFPHPYPSERVVALPSLVSVAHRAPDSTDKSLRRALVMGQPLTGDRRMTRADVADASAAIENWLTEQGIEQVWFKPHPRDAGHDLRRASWQILEPDVPIEQHLADVRYDAIAGVTSTTLFLAREICGDRTRIGAFGTDRFDWRIPGKRDQMLALMQQLGIERPDLTNDRCEMA